MMHKNSELRIASWKHAVQNVDFEIKVNISIKIRYKHSVASVEYFFNSVFLQKSDME